MLGAKGSHGVDGFWSRVGGSIDTAATRREGK